MAYGSQSVTTSAVEIVAANDQRKSVSIVNSDASDIVYIGSDSSVTSSNGLPLYPYQGFGFIKNIAEHWKGPIFGITASGTADVRYWEVTQ